MALERTKDLDEVLGGLEEGGSVDTLGGDGDVDERLGGSASLAQARGSLFLTRLRGELSRTSGTYLGDGLEELGLGHGG